ncbi:MAG: hypothetical protein AAGK71_04860 [Pseudomonadota bacterium]
MSYYLRFISEDTLPSVPELVERWRGLEALQFAEIDAGAATIEDEGGVIASIEINRPGDGMFDDELAELCEDVEAAEGAGDAILQTLKAAKATLVFEVLFGDNGFEAPLLQLDPLVASLQTWYKGLLQADGEGFFRGKDLILAIE